MTTMLKAVPPPNLSPEEAGGIGPVSGRRPAFEALYRASRDDLYSYVAGLLRDRSQAEDVTALAFERAFRKWSKFDPKRGSARGWLFGIARNAALDELRKRGREIPAGDFDESGGLRPGRTSGGHAPGDEASVEASVLESERRRALLAALGRLPPADREMVSLKFFAGLSNAEIAEATGYTTTNVGTRVSRAMTRLRSALGDSGEEVAR